MDIYSGNNTVIQIELHRYRLIYDCLYIKRRCTITYGCKYSKSEGIDPFNLSVAEAWVFLENQVNIMATHALVPCVARSSAAVVLTVNW